MIFFSHFQILFLNLPQEEKLNTLKKNLLKVSFIQKQHNIHQNVIISHSTLGKTELDRTIKLWLLFLSL